MDAREGDYIEFKILTLYNAKITAVIGPEFEQTSKTKGFRFTEVSLRQGPGVIKIPYPYQCFFTLTYDKTFLNDGRDELDSLWSYQIKFVIDPTATQIYSSSRGFAVRKEVLI